MNSFDQHVREVGDQFFKDPGATFPQGAQVTFSTKYVTEMVIFLPDPTPGEIRAVEEGLVRFALVTQPSILLLLATFSVPGQPTKTAIPWFDCPWQAVREEHPGFPEGQGGHLALPITLVDTRTGTIKAMRLVTLSPEMTSTLRSAVEYQVANPATDAQAQEAISFLYSRYPTNAALVEQRAEVTCTGGE